MNGRDDLIYRLVGFVAIDLSLEPMPEPLDRIIFWTIRSEMLLVGSRTGAVTLDTGINCCRRLSPSAGVSDHAMIPFPAPAASHAACGFPALRAPARFTSRVMRPIVLEKLSVAAVWVATRDSCHATLTFRTATIYSTASSRSLGVVELASDDAESSFPPSRAHRKNSGLSGRWQSSSPTLARSG